MHSDLICTWSAVGEPPRVSPVSLETSVLTHYGSVVSADGFVKNSDEGESALEFFFFFFCCACRSDILFQLFIPKWKLEDLNEILLINVLGALVRVLASCKRSLSGVSCPGRIFVPTWIPNKGACNPQTKVE